MILLRGRFSPSVYEKKQARSTIIGMLRLLYMLFLLLAEGDLHVAALTAAFNGEGDGVAWRFFAEELGQILKARDGAAVGGGDHIAHADACFISWPAVGDTGHENAGGLIDADLVGQIFIKAVAADANPGFFRRGVGVFSILDAVDKFQHGVGWDRKTHAFNVAHHTGGRNLQRVDADELRLAVQERAAAVAVVDRGVGLDVADIAVFAGDLAVECR